MDLINGLKEERALLVKKLEAIDVLLESYGSINKRDADYPANGSYLKQIAYIIKKANRFLHNSEITGVIKNYSDKDLNFLSRRISSVLSKAKEEEEGNLTSVTIGASKRNTFWGSKEWLNNDGKPLEDHMYNAELIVMKRTKGINI